MQEPVRSSGDAGIVFAMLVGFVTIIIAGVTIARVVVPDRPVVADTSTRSKQPADPVAPASPADPAVPSQLETAPPPTGTTPAPGPGIERPPTNNSPSPTVPPAPIPVPAP